MERLKLLHKFGEYEVQTTRHTNVLGNTCYRGYLFYKGRSIAEKSSFMIHCEADILEWAKDEIQYHKDCLNQLREL